MQLLNGYNRKSLFLCSKDKKTYEVSANSSRKQTARDVSNLDLIQSELILSEGFYIWYRIHHSLFKSVIQQAAECLFLELTSKIFHIIIHTATHGQGPSRKTDARKDWSKTTRHYPEWITCYIKDKHVTHQLNIYSFVLIITDLFVGHLNLFVVVDVFLIVL